MIPFHRIYSWLFKSFSIGEETLLLRKLHTEGYNNIILIKRSWIYIFFVLWIPVLLVILSGLSIWIAYDSIDIPLIKYTIIAGNILMHVILFPTTILYIKHFRDIHHKASLLHDPVALIEKVEQGDAYFIRYFNWSLTNQFLLVVFALAEVTLVIIMREHLGKHFLVLLADLIVIFAQLYFVQMFRAKMINLEMDFNIVVPGKLYTVNQTGILSNTQTLDGDKIKTVRATFPSKIASFFNYGNIDILTEGDEGTLGAITLYYVPSPKEIAADMENMLAADRIWHQKQPETQTVPEQYPSQPKNHTSSPEIPSRKKEGSDQHSIKTREKIRDILQ